MVKPQAKSTKEYLAGTFNLKEASERIERLMPRREHKKQWKYEGDRLTLEDEDFDYDISPLDVCEDQE